MPTDLPWMRSERGVLVAAVDMGYGHLRAAHALASALGQEVVEVDREPFATPAESRLWSRLRTAYTVLSRASQAPVVGRPLDWLLRSVTEIPRLYPYRDQSSPTLGVEVLHWLIRRGLGRNLVHHLKRTGDALLTTFFAPALATAEAGVPRLVCVVTDSDINRVWAPRQPRGTHLEYCVPSQQALRRLRAFGVPAARIHFTGFPLPEELIGDEDVQKRQVAARLVRLDPAGTFRGQYREELVQVLGAVPEGESHQPPRLTFAVGGAGVQDRIAQALVHSLAPAVRAGRLRLALVAGVRSELAERFQAWLGDAGLAGAGEDSVEVLHAPGLSAYFSAFNQLLLRTDILWTKPSELTFFAAAGIALIFAPPVGAHESFNRRWAIQRGAGLSQYSPATAGQWLNEWLQEGILAGAAWAGFRRLPRHGTAHILGVLRRVSGGQ